jgi:hypothetical protein
MSASRLCQREGQPEPAGVDNITDLDVECLNEAGRPWEMVIAGRKLPQLARLHGYGFVVDVQAVREADLRDAAPLGGTPSAENDDDDANAPLGGTALRSCIQDQQALAVLQQSVQQDETAEMTLEQKAQLAGGINRLNSNHLAEVVRLVRENMPEGQGIEIDINTLDNRTLWKLHNFLRTCQAPAQLLLPAQRLGRCAGFPCRSCNPVQSTNWTSVTTKWKSTASVQSASPQRRCSASCCRPRRLCAVLSTPPPFLVPQRPLALS